MNRSSWPLLALVCARGHRLTPIQMQKTLFVLGEELGRPSLGEGFYHFEPYHYGPFDTAVNKDIEDLERAGLVNIVDTTTHRGRDYELTSQGLTAASELLHQIPGDQSNYLKLLVRWVQSLSFRELVAAIYRAYPQMAQNSVFRQNQ